MVVLVLLAVRSVPDRCDPPPRTALPRCCGARPGVAANAGAALGWYRG